MRDARRSSLVGPRSLIEDWWFPLCALLLILASDFEFRTRPPEEATGGTIDLSVLLEVAVYGLVAVFLASRARFPRIRRTSPPAYFATLYVGVLVLSVLYAEFFDYAITRAAQLCVVLALTLSAASRADRAHMHRFAHGFLVITIAGVLYGVVVPSAPVSNLQEDRFSWLAIHPTVSGAICGLAVVVALSYLTSSDDRPGPDWGRLGYLTSLVIVAGGLIATHTRGAVLGAAAGSAVVLVASRRGREAVGMLFVLALAGTAGTLAVGSEVAAYFVRGERVDQLTTLNSRTDLWAVAFDAVERQPLFGYGVTSSRGIFLDAIDLGGGHNAVVNVLVDAGIVGLFTWAAFVVTLAAGVRRLPKDPAAGVQVDRTLLLAAITFLMVDGIFFEGPGSVANVACTWLFVCLAWFGVVRRGDAPAGARGAAPSEAVPIAVARPRELV